MRRVILLTALCAAPSLPAEDASAREFFESKIRPVFARNCAACHSASMKMGGLDMSSREALLKGGQTGPAIVPAKPEESLLFQAVAHTHQRLKMPLEQQRLPAAQIAAIGAWIRDGASWPEAKSAAVASKGGKYVITAEQRSFWAFQPVRKAEPPAVKNTAWVRTPVDRFLLARIEEKGVTVAQPADRRTLIRRAYYDLTGLPPSAAQVEAFVHDPAPDAFAKVVDSLLRSPRYGERWARYWLDVARYSDDRLESEVDAPYENAFRYRDWVIQAFNEDMPYRDFVKAQIAGDLMPDRAKFSGGLGFYALRPDTQDDRVDVTGRAFLALTTGCAQCHDHKFDPIPTTDFYALQGVFSSTKESEYPLAPEAAVKDYKARAKAVDDKREQIRQFLYGQAAQLSSVLAQQTGRYVNAARIVLGGGKPDSGLDAETLHRWVKYLGDPAKDHPYLKDWADKTKFDAARFQQIVLDVLAERKRVDDENAFRRAEAKKTKKTPEVVSLQTSSFYLWRDLFFNDFYGNQFKQEDDGLLYYGPNRGYVESDGTVERFLSGIWKDHLTQLRQELAELKARLPEHYPFLHTIEDAEKLETAKVRVGGSDENLGEEVPRRFLTILSQEAPKPFTKGAGRLELAEAIASPENPLTARVMVNRIWQHHFGFGIVRTPSDFGFMGDRPSHPELLDYLAAKFVESGWSVKAIHREIMLSSAYQTSSTRVTANAELDPDNRLFWRANVRRLDAEALRDSMLAVTGTLDPVLGGRPLSVSDPANRRRTVYGFVSRRKTDPALSLFDFPNPNGTSEKRVVTITPPQQLFFLNSEFVEKQARALVSSASKAATPEEQIRQLYRTVFGRLPEPSELRLASEFLGRGNTRLPLYAQALLSSNEFLFVN